MSLKKTKPSVKKIKSDLDKLEIELKDFTPDFKEMKPTVPLTLIFLFFFASIAATIIAWLTVSNAVDNKARQFFYNGTNSVASWIQTRLQTYSDLLVATQSFAESQPRFTRAQWTDFVQGLDLTERYPGMRAIIYLARVKKADLNSFTQTVRKENSDLPAYSNFTVSPLANTQEYFPITYTYGANEPKRLETLGLNVYSEASRISTLDYARDRNKLVFSPVIELLIEPHTAGFSITLPIYRYGAKIDTVSQRRDALIGFVYAPFQADQFFDAILKPGGTDAFPDLDVEIYDLASSDKPFYDIMPQYNLNDPAEFFVTKDYQITVDDRTWTIKIGLPKTLYQNTKTTPVPLTIFAIGLLASIITFIFLLHEYGRILKIGRQLRK